MTTVRKLGMIVLILGILLPTLAGCATDRFLTQEQDDQMREQCQLGCKVIPGPIWNQIIQRLRGQGV